MKHKIVILMALIGIFAAFGFLNFYYLEAIKSNYDLGVTDGKNSGFLSGNETGYQLGFKDGNQSGFEYGYQIGYSKGNYSGYSFGYNKGNQTGYKLGYYYGKKIGYANGYLQGVKDGAGTGYNIRDPTYQEMLNFIAVDKTDQNEYSENYTCFHFTADVKGNAFKNGIKCGFVYIRFPYFAHAIVCFNTTDYGVIFVEPQDDCIVMLIIGQPYWDRSKYIAPYDDTIVSFVIIW